MVYEYKLIVCGPGGVGKSAIVLQFIKHSFSDEYDPTIEDSYRVQENIDGDVVLLDILDTAGQEEYSTMRDQYMRTGQGFLIIYSITNRETFDEVSIFHRQILQAREVDEVPMVLVGNKLDLEQLRKIPTTDGEELAKQLNMPFLEASAKTRHNIKEVFYQLVREIKKTMPKVDEKSLNIKAKLHSACSIL